MESFNAERGPCGNSVRLSICEGHMKTVELQKFTPLVSPKVG